jgi:hypothetical protein
MQRSGSTPTSNAAPFFSTSFFGGGGGNGSSSRSRPGTSSGEQNQQLQQQQQQFSNFNATNSTGNGYPNNSSNSGSTNPPNVLTKDRKGSFGRKSSFSSPSKSSKRRANSSSQGTIVTDSSRPPALPDFALAAAAKISRETDVIQSPASGDSFGKMMSGRTPTQAGYAVGQQGQGQGLGISGGGAGGQNLAVLNPTQVLWQQTESGIVHHHIQEIANKRISTLDYLRKA